MLSENLQQTDSTPRVQYWFRMLMMEYRRKLKLPIKKTQGSSHRLSIQLESGEKQTQPISRTSVYIINDRKSKKFMEANFKIEEQKTVKYKSQPSLDIEFTNQNLNPETSRAPQLPRHIEMTLKGTAYNENHIE